MAEADVRLEPSDVFPASLVEVHDGVICLVALRDALLAETDGARASDVVGEDQVRRDTRFVMAARERVVLREATGEKE